MADDVLIAQYPKQAVVRDRNFSALVAWAASMTAQPTPVDPDDEWVRLRVVAERIPQGAAGYVERTMAFFIQDPTTVVNIREFLNPWNSPTVEDSLSHQNAAIIEAFMPRFSVIDVPPPQVEAWRLALRGPAAPGEERRLAGAMSHAKVEPATAGATKASPARARPIGEEPAAHRAEPAARTGR